MPNLLDGLRNSVNALRATGEAIAITQMNMTNAGLAGYAKQVVNQTADTYDPAHGLTGGMRGSSSSARSQFAEQAVWSLTSQKGFLETLTQSANGVDAILGSTDSSGKAGLQGTLTGLFQSFNGLTQGASDPVQQAEVIQQARGFALTLSQTADFLAQSGAMAQSRAHIAVNQINGLVKSIQQWNSEVGTGAEPDPVAEAQMYASLETLSSLIPISVQKDFDGSITILLNGQTPLLQRTVASPLTLAYRQPDAGDPFPDAAAQLRIQNPAGEDVTDAIDAGQLGGLIEYSNKFLPTLLGDATRQGDLNRLAESVANSANSALGGGTPMFIHDTNVTNAARTFALNPDFDSADLMAAIQADSSVLSKLTDIVAGSNPTNQIDGQSFAAFFVSLSTRVAIENSTAQDGLKLRSGLVEQARSFRERIQGASVEESAVQLLEYQRAFEAAAKVIGVIDELTKTTMEMFR